MPFVQARAVHIALVQSPVASLGVDYSLPLRKHFRSPRLLSLGDLIPVVLPSPRYPRFAYGAEDEHDDDDEIEDEDEDEDETEDDIHSGREGDVIYFKVTRGTGRA